MTRRAMFRSLLVLPVVAMTSPSLVPIVDLTSSLTITCDGVTRTIPVRVAAFYKPLSCLPPTLSDLERRICKLVTTKTS